MSALANLSAKSKPFFTAAANLLFPPQCAACGADTDAAHSFCLDCFSQLSLIAPPFCYRCGVPFAFSLGEKAVCAACLHEEPPYRLARSAMLYDPLAQRLVTRLKYGDRQELLPALAQQLWRAGIEVTNGADFLIPVPLHPKRLRERRFNQSALLAMRLSRRCGVPALVDGMKRVRHTPPQASLNRKERLTNVTRAFAVNHRHAARLRGTCVVLIDDVMTTGATIHACCQALLGAMVREVRVLTLARTLKE